MDVQACVSAISTTTLSGKIRYSHVQTKEIRPEVKLLDQNFVAGQ